MNIQTLIKERRAAVAGIAPQSLIEFLQPNPNGHIRIPQFVGIPNDAVCTQVRYDSNLDMFMFLFYHEDFQKVPTGQQFPLRYTELFTYEFNVEPRKP